MAEAEETADIESTTVNEEEFFASSRVGDFELSIDATGEDGPTPNEVLVADYASCYSFALRAGAMRNDFEDPGKVQTEAAADLDDEDDLESIAFTMHLETDYSEEELDELRELADEICHVHSAVREGLHAEVDIHADQF